MRLRATRSRALLIVSLATSPGWSQPVAPAEVSEQARAEAKQAFAAASQHFDGKRFEEALATFRSSYQVVASPNTRLMIARTLRELGRDVEAYQEYSATLTDAGAQGERYAGAATAAAEEQTEVRGKVALVTVRVAEARAGMEVRLGGEPFDLGRLGTPFPVAPGVLGASVSAPDGAAGATEITATAGGTHEVVLALVAAPEAPPPPPPPPVAEQRVEASQVSLRTWAFVAAGVGVAGIATFAIVGSMANSKFDDLESTCKGGTCPPDKQEDIDSGKTYQLVANVGLGLGVVGLGTGALLYLLEPKREAASTGTTVHVSVGPGSVSVGGSLW